MTDTQMSLNNMDPKISENELYLMLRELTDKELLYFMAKMIEEQTRRLK